MEALWKLYGSHSRPDRARYGDDRSDSLLAWQEVTVRRWKRQVTASIPPAGVIITTAARGLD